MTKSSIIGCRNLGHISVFISLIWAKEQVKPDNFRAFIALISPDLRFIKCASDAFGGKLYFLIIPYSALV